MKQQKVIKRNWEQLSGLAGCPVYRGVFTVNMKYILKKEEDVAGCSRTQTRLHMQGYNQKKNHMSQYENREYE